MNKIVFNSQIDYVKESIFLLIMAGCDKTYAGLKKEYEKKAIKVSQLVIEKYDFLISVENKLQKKLKGHEEDMKYYFGKEYSQGRNIGEMVVLGDDYSEPLVNPEAVKKQWEKFDSDKAEYITEFDKELFMYSSVVYDIDAEANHAGEEIDVIRKIMSMDISDEEKCKLQEVFLFPQKHREKMLVLLGIAMDVIKDCENKILEYNKDFVEYWTRTLNGVKMTDFIYDSINIKLDEAEYGYILSSHIFMPFSVGISFDRDDNEKISKPYVIHFGFLFDDDYSMSSDEGKDKYDEKAIADLKLLSDKSKFEILSMLKNQRTYGGELARSLNLTPATISHHMSALLTAGIVRVEKADNRIYYSTNEEELKKLFSFCSDRLL